MICKNYITNIVSDNVVKIDTNVYIIKENNKQFFINMMLLLDNEIIHCPKCQTVYFNIILNGEKITTKCMQCNNIMNNK